MRTAFRTSLLAAGLAGLAAAAVAQAPKSIQDGAYTDAQAERGHAAYVENCQACHGTDLAGVGEARPLAGPEFLSAWNGLSLGELFDRIRTTMPIDRPGALSRETNADITAYILKYNGFPAGKDELSGKSEVLAGVRFDAFKPAAAVEADPNGAPNPYAGDKSFLKLPAGRSMGSTSSVGVDSKGHIWVVDRCAANSCAGSALDPVMEFDAKGTFIKAFGKGLFNFPHGFFIDAHDHLWITDNRAEGGKGCQVFEIDPSGKVLRTLGKAGVSGDGPDVFTAPNAVVVAKDGTIFVSDGHNAGQGAHRILKFDASGRFLKQWGVRGSEPGQIEVPHALALDSGGRLFVADRWNNRVQIFDQDGKSLAVWSQFGRPSAIFIDRNDVLYVGDSESRTPDGYGHHPGWRRGVRIGSVRDGKVRAFIPDDEPNPDAQATSGAEGLAVDPNGVVYAAEVGQKAVVRFTKAR